MIYAVPHDIWAVGHCRIRWPALACAAQGLDVRIVEAGERDVFGALASRSTGQVVSVMAPDDCEVIVMQRPTSGPLVRSISAWRAQGIAVVVDMDDDLSTISPSNPAFAVHHPTRDPENHWGWAERACKDATLVTCSTPTLAERYGGHGRVRVLRNRVPDHYFETVPRRPWEDGFGWAGTMASHPDDLQTLGSAAARLVRAGHPFRVVGPSAGVGRALGLDGDPEETGMVSFAVWPGQVGRLNVGIAPLADTVFSRAKSEWKLLEYLALGVPWVASDLPEYRRLAEHGSVVARPREWLRELSRLLNDSGLRAERSEAGREAARTMTYSLHAHEWADAWEHARTIQAAAARVS